MLNYKMKFLLVLSIVVLSISFVGCTPSTSNQGSVSDDESQKVVSIFDAPLYSRITKADLFEKFGETSDVEEWNNETTKGTFPMTIYSYDDKNSNHYEFIVANDSDSVVRVTIYSAKNWAGTGTDIKYTKKSINEMLALLNITPNDSAKVAADTGEAYRIRPVSDTIGDVWFLGMTNDDSTFNMVKVTYNLNYFD